MLHTNDDMATNAEDVEIVFQPYGGKVLKVPKGKMFIGTCGTSTTSGSASLFLISNGGNFTGTAGQRLALPEGTYISVASSTTHVGFIGIICDLDPAKF